MQKQQTLCDTTYLSTYDNSYYISAAASHLNTQSHHTHRPHGTRVRYKLFQKQRVAPNVARRLCCTVCRSRIRLLPSDVRDGDKRWPGQAGLHGAAEAADRVSSRAGLVNPDIINTPLTAFGFTSRDEQARARTEYTCWCATACQ